MKNSPQDTSPALQALSLLAEKGWSFIQPSDIAQFHVQSKTDLIPLIVHFIDEEWEKAVPPHAESDTTEDRLFDLLMIRFEVMQKHKPALCELADATLSDHKGAITMYQALLKSMKMTQVIVSNHKLIPSALQTHALLGIYVLAFYKWADEKSDEMPRTMAGLNATLQTCKKYITLA